MPVQGLFLILLLIIGDNPEKRIKHSSFVKIVKWCNSLDIETSLSSSANIFKFCINEIEKTSDIVPVTMMLTFQNPVHIQWNFTRKKFLVQKHFPSLFKVVLCTLSQQYIAIVYICIYTYFFLCPRNKIYISTMWAHSSRKLSLFWSSWH